MKFLKTYEALSQEELEKRRMGSVFKNEVWKKIPKDDQNKIINLRYSLSELRDQARYLVKRGDNRTDIAKQIKDTQKTLKNLENKYYDMYRDLYDFLTNKTLTDMNSKTGVFESKMLPF